MKKLLNLLTIILLGGLSTVAYSAGFGSAVSGKMTELREAILIVVGVVATIALLWQMAEGFMGKKTWPDVFQTCLWILGAGAAVAIANWVFTTGQGISF